MCILAGAGAAAGGLAGLGTALSVASTVVGIMGTMQQAKLAAAANAQQRAHLEAQKQEQQQLAAVEEWRMRQQRRAEMRQQQARIGAAGLDLGSPTALFLGQQAAKDVAFEGAAIRQRAGSQARQLTADQEALSYRTAQAVTRARYNVADTLLTAPRRIWPELLS